MGNGKELKLLGVGKGLDFVQGVDLGPEVVEKPEFGEVFGELVDFAAEVAVEGAEGGK